MVKGKKITKKRLKEPDEFIHFTERIYLMIKHNSKLIATGGIIAFILLLSIFLFYRWEQSKEAEAHQKFGLALSTYQMVISPYQQGATPDIKNALEKFDEVVEKFPRTSSGKLSYLYKGNIHLRLGEFEEAIKSFEAILKKGAKEKLYHLFAMEGLGYAYEGKKDYEKALHAYRKVIEKDSGSEISNIYLNIGRCYEKLGKNKEALENYKTFLKSSQKSIMANAIMRKISYLEK